MKTCPFCREEVQTEAIKCKHCASVLEVDPAAVHAEKEAKRRLGVPGLILVIIFSAAAYFAASKIVEIASDPAGWDLFGLLR
jgi:hypothetical protein